MGAGDARDIGEDSDGPVDSEGDGDASELDSVFFVVVDFFEGEAEDSAVALELFFVVLVLEPDGLLLDFFVVEAVELVPDPFEDFFLADIDELLALVELEVVCFLLAHAVTKASAARMVMQLRTVFFIGVRAVSLSQVGLRAQAF